MLTKKKVSASLPSLATNSASRSQPVTKRSQNLLKSTISRASFSRKSKSMAKMRILCGTGWKQHPYVFHSFCYLTCISEGQRNARKRHQVELHKVCRRPFWPGRWPSRHDYVFREARATNRKTSSVALWITCLWCENWQWLFIIDLMGGNHLFLQIYFRHFEVLFVEKIFKNMRFSDRVNRQMFDLWARENG